MSIYLQIDNLTKSFGDLVLFQHISFAIEENQRIGLIARNGAGKTTLLNIISGKEGYDEGNILLNKDIRIGYLPQEPTFPEGTTVLDACFYDENEVTRTIARYEKALQEGNQEELDESMHLMELHGAWDYETRAKQILTQLKITNFDQKTEQLSGGQLKRVALASVLISEPNFIILDEPTNHLDMEMVEWLENYLGRGNIGLLMVTHDRYFLDRVCNEIIEIDQRQLYRYKGNYSYYLEKRDERVEAQNAEVERAKNLLRKELDWMRRQPQARATKAKYRIDAFYKLEEKAKQQRDQGNVKLEVKAAYIGNKIFEIKGLKKAYGALKLVDGFEYVFARYEKLGIIGNNGTGKSTFIKMLTGQVAPDAGEIEIGETVRFGYYSQDGLRFDEQMKVIDVVKNIAEVIQLGNSTLTASQFLQHFLFTPESQHSYVYKLSGGEKRRLYLCTVLMANPNFLVLDEPTNDLDIATLTILEDYLQAFKGCVIVVSHDRYFMDKVVDHIWVFKGNAEINDFPGNYTDYRDGPAEDDQLKKAELLDKQKKEPTKKIDSPANAPKQKLTYKEQKEFERLGEEIEQLEQEKKTIEEALGSGLLSNDELVKKSERISQIMGEIDEKSMRWLELSEFV